MGALPLFPEQASTHAVRVDHLLYFMLAFSGGLTLLIFVLIVSFAIKYRERPGNQVAEQTVGSNRLELLWTIVPLGIAMVMYVWGASLYFDLARPPADAIEVSAVGKQWMWKFQHPGGQREINALHVPVGRPVKLTMTSEDVIHDLFVPAFRTKQDVLPGRYSTTWFEATRPGSYHLFCSQYCGTQHSGMVGEVIAMEPARFQAWLAGGATEGSTAQAGETLFQQLGCASCHTNDAHARCPVLLGLFGRTVELQGGGSVTADESYIRESIVDPNAKIVLGYEPIMPTYQGLVSEEGILQLIAYLKSLGKGEEAR